jgi:hypothetical protein
LASHNRNYLLYRKLQVTGRAPSSENSENEPIEQDCLPDDNGVSPPDSPTQSSVDELPLPPSIRIDWSRFYDHIEDPDNPGHQKQKDLKLQKEWVQVTNEDDFCEKIKVRPRL